MLLGTVFFVAVSTITPPCANPAPLSVGTCYVLNSYIVVLQPGNDPNALAQEFATKYGGTIRHVFPALDAFELDGLTPDAVAQMRCESAVKAISMDQPGFVSDPPPCNIPAVSPGMLLLLACALAFAGARIIR